MVVRANLSKGFTLIEVLVALAILAILLLGLLAGLLTSIDYNLRNYTRDEAKRLALECAENLRNFPYENLPQNGSVDCRDQNSVSVSNPCTDLETRITNGTPEQVTRQVRNAFVSYTIGWNVSTSGDIKEVQIQVCWNYRGRSYSHTITTLVGRRSE